MDPFLSLSSAQPACHMPTATGLLFWAQFSLLAPLASLSQAASSPQPLVSLYGPNSLLAPLSQAASRTQPMVFFYRSNFLLYLRSARQPHARDHWSSFIDPILSLSSAQPARPLLRQPQPPTPDTSDHYKNLTLMNNLDRTRGSRTPS